jgi:bifunctional UDP-N-acetylglucosamine pyrophosphorylase / glucosamine-1-phosphate N-acetyltransferase
VITGSVIGEGVHVKPYSVITEATIGAGAVVGPFAHCRPGTVLDEEVHLGNFVETKKAHLGRGAKANHLSYLGDAEIGPKVNVGAGTITCNYDGAQKHPTTIEEGAFIGSNTALVAPVKVGKGAYVAAGTTVTEDVPDGALGIGRARQVNKEGYTEKRKQIPS